MSRPSNDAHRCPRRFRMPRQRPLANSGKALSNELAPKGIRVNAVAPGASRQSRPPRWCGGSPRSKLLAGTKHGNESWSPSEEFRWVHRAGRRRRRARRLPGVRSGGPHHGRRICDRRRRRAHGLTIANGSGWDRARCAWCRRRAGSGPGQCRSGSTAGRYPAATDTDRHRVLA